jgi:hypothetical protein
VKGVRMGKWHRRNGLQTSNKGHCNVM